jgi:hypothetical protein
MMTRERERFNAVMLDKAELRLSVDHLPMSADLEVQLVILKLKALSGDDD